jgi:hypothetical protein
MICLYIIALATVIKKYTEQRSGKILDIKDSLSYGTRNFARLFETILLLALIIGGPIILILLMIFFGIFSNLLILVGLGALLLIIIILPLIYIGLRLSLTIQACVVEELSPIESIKKSWEIAKGNLIKIFVLSFLIGIIGIIISAPFIIAGYAGFPLIQYIGIIIVYSFIWPLSAISFTSLYIALTKNLPY